MLVSVDSANSCVFIVCGACYSLHFHMPRGLVCEVLDLILRYACSSSSLNIVVPVAHSTSHIDHKWHPRPRYAIYPLPQSILHFSRQNPPTTRSYSAAPTLTPSTHSPQYLSKPLRTCARGQTISPPPSALAHACGTLCP
jgi:hypothetical protein